MLEKFSSNIETGGNNLNFIHNTSYKIQLLNQFSKFNIRETTIQESIFV